MQLTEKVLAYQAGNWTWTDLWKDIFLAIDNFLTTRNINSELADQVITQLTPRFHDMVGNFADQGKTFEAFLFTAVRYQLKTAYAQRRKERELENSLQLYQAGCPEPQSDCAEFEETAIINDQPDPDFKGMGHHCSTFAQLPGENRRIAIVALKNCAALDDSLCAVLSAKLGLNLTWFMNCRDELRDLASARMDIYRKLRERERSAAFAVQCASTDPIEEAKKRDKLAVIRRNLERMNPYPRHQDIARVLGIPKGTVDSSLFYVRRMLANTCQKQGDAS